ncbi:MAG: methyltransferase domain-containing protein [Saprospiraceae bacterium]
MQSQTTGYFCSVKWRWKIAQFFEGLWWKVYLFGKSEYYYLLWKKNYWRAFLKKADITAGTGEHIIEVGSGPAGIFMMFPENKVTAVEPLLPKYEKLLTHFGSAALKNVTFVAVPFEDYSPVHPFDKVFCLNVINHVRDLPTCMNKLFDLTKKGGRLYISVDAHRWNFLKKVFQLIPWDVLHPYQHSLHEYECMLESRGFFIGRVGLIKSTWIFNYYLIVAKK